MAKKVTLKNLDKAIADILKEYEGDVDENVKLITAAVTKKGANTLRNESLSTFSNVNLPRGRYGSGWTSQIETGRFTAQGTIYNSKYPGLPHLLEYGHAIRNGGRIAPEKAGFTNAYAHIKPIEEKIVKEYIQKIEAAL